MLRQLKFLPHKEVLFKLFIPVRRMSNTTPGGLIAVCQMTAKSNKEDNFRTCRTLIENAVNKGAQMVFLPEACDFIGESRDQTLTQAESLSGPLITQYKELAKKLGVWLSLGGLHEKVEESDYKRIGNNHVILSSEGQIVASYRKAHLFDVEIPESNVKLKESEYVVPGNEIKLPVETPVGKVGLGICYDMRFPELSICLARMGAQLLTYPSAFTVNTGLAHWETLLRARAIETQCYVVAAAQTGIHNKKRSSYGHAMVVDPWGAVIGQCSEGTGFALAEINLSYLHKVRREMPVWLHRRNDLYGEVNVQTNNGEMFPDDEEIFSFGKVSLKGKMVFYRTKMSIAFVNRKCVVEGHVLVMPIQAKKKLLDLSPEELKDMFVTVQKVQKILETIHKTESYTVTIQDGPDAGQTIQHVHVHVLPRKPDDFARNDDIYVALKKHDKEDNVKWREEKSMEEEAKMLRECAKTLF